MSYIISTDTASNIPTELINKHNLTIIPLTFIVDGVEKTCMDLSAFDGDSYYKDIRHHDIKTSTVNMHQYIEAWEPILKDGKDILHFSISSGISSAYSVGCAAADVLRSEYPTGKIYVIDTLAASLGEGLQALKAAEYLESGMDIKTCVKTILGKREKTKQVFSVDDLNFLKKGGRISTTAAAIGTMLHVKPILTSNYLGEIIVDKKVRGRSGALKAIVDAFSSNFDKRLNDPVGLVYAGCESEAKTLLDALKKIAPKTEFLLSSYEPVTGSHVGPGTLALFYTAC